MRISLDLWRLRSSTRLSCKSDLCVGKGELVRVQKPIMVHYSIYHTRTCSSLYRYSGLVRGYRGKTECPRQHEEWKHLLAKSFLQEHQIWRCNPPMAGPQNVVALLWNSQSLFDKCAKCLDEGALVAWWAIDFHIPGLSQQPAMISRPLKQRAGIFTHHTCHS